MKKLIMLFSLVLSTFFITTTVEASFKDVPANHRYATEINWGVKKQIISGYDDNTFKPDANVTEAQFAKIYTNFFNFDKSKQTVSGEHWSNEFYRTLQDYDIEMLGTNISKMRSASINRGTVAEMIGYGLGTARSVPDAIDYLFEQKITNGKFANKANPLDRFGAAEKITRAELVVFFYRLEQMGKNKLDRSVIAKHAKNYPANELTKKYKKISHLIDNVYIGITEAEPKNLAFELFKGNQAVAGYISKDGTQIGSYTIGKSYSASEKVEETINGKAYTLYFDHQKNNKLLAAYWTDPSFDYYKYYSNDVPMKDSIGHSKLTMLLINNYRAKLNLPALSHYDALVHAAYAHSKDMHKNDYFAHAGKNGTKAENRITAAGLKYKVMSKQAVVGENLAFLGASRNGPFDAVNNWINSPSHRSVLSFKDFTVMAVGVTNGYFTLNFMDPEY
ncbi:S-layer homology domain-containing protein [Solibacillus silvestris]|uniref:CAP and S-layer homology domain-containing protein n=1 Tax=Solibacillus silvestris TaxID=76853 RepID=UPI003F7FA9B3